MPETEATRLPSLTGKGPRTCLAIDPAEKPLHFKSFRVMSTEVIEAPSSETVSFIVPLLAFSLISMGPLKVAPGLGAAGLARVAVGLGKKEAVHSLETSFLDYTVPLGERAPGRVGSLNNDITANGLFNCYYPTRFSIDYYRQTGCFLSNLRR